MVSLYCQCWIEQQVLSAKSGNEENNFTVARLQAGKSRDLITIVGNMPCPNPRETLRLRGEWVIDAKFGRQFRVESCL